MPEEKEETVVTKKVTNLDKTPTQTREYINAVTGKKAPGMTDAIYEDLKAQGHPLSNIKVKKIK